MRKHVHQWGTFQTAETISIGDGVWIRKNPTTFFACRICGEPGYDASEKRIEALRKRWSS